jgi:ribulose-phosphate 3-epimerase
MAEVIPAILENDFTEIEKKIKSVDKLVKWVQVDFADNTLVPNSTFIDPTPFSKIDSVKMEGHFMVKKPLDYIEKFANVGFTRFFAHVECEQVEGFIEKCLQLGVDTGLAIDGPTPIEKIQPFLKDIDVVLVMAIDAGFSGRPFREDTISKIIKIHEAEFDLPIAVDGAMDYENAKKVVNVGTSRINSNSYIFKASDISIPINKLASLVPEGIRP